MLIKLFLIHKTTGEVWDPWELVILIQKALFWMQKNNRWGLAPIESSNSGPNVAVLDEKQQKRAGTNRDW